MFGQRGHVGLVVTATQDTGEYLWMQRLYAAVHDFGEAGVSGDLGYRDEILDQLFCGAAGGEDIDAFLLQRSGEFNDARFIRYADQRSAYRSIVWVYHGLPSNEIGRAADYTQE